MEAQEMKSNLLISIGWTSIPGLTLGPLQAWRTPFGQVAYIDPRINIFRGCERPEGINDVTAKLTDNRKTTQ
jgi:hypothetical protein